MASANVSAVLVIQHGKIVLERYRLGNGPAVRWTSFSVAKSISSTLVGIAVADGRIGSLEDPVMQYLPALVGSAYDGVTIRQLLTMTSGVGWNENYLDPQSDVARIRAATAHDGHEPIVAYMAQLKRVAAPGTRFSYSTGETHLVGALLRSATGRPLANYLSEKLWRLLGMEHDAAWLLDSGGNEFAGC